MKLNEFLKEIEFCTRRMSEEEKDAMEVTIEIENGLVPREVSFVESTENTLYIISKAERRAAA